MPSSYFIFKSKYLSLRYLLELLVYVLFCYLLILSPLSYFPFNNIFVVFILCVIFVPLIRNFIKTEIDNIFLRKYRDILRNLKMIAYDTNKIYSVRDILKIIVLDVRKTINIDKSEYYQFKEPNNCYESTFGNLENEIIINEHPIIRALREKYNYIYIEHLDDSQEDHVLYNSMVEMGITLVFPIFSGDAITGIVVYGKKLKNKKYNQYELNELKNIIEKAQEQIHNIWHLEYLKENYSEEILQKLKNTYQMQILRDTKRLGNTRDITELTEHLVEMVNRSVNAEYTHIYIFDELKGVYTYKKGTIGNNQLPVYIKEDQKLMSYLRRNRGVLICDTLQKWADENTFVDIKESAKLSQDLGAKLILPLFDVTLIGFIVIGAKRDNLHFSKDDFFVLSFIADRAEINISNVLIREKSDRDMLTGLHCKNYFNRRAKEEIAKCLRYGGIVNYFRIDIDELRWFNDFLGHAVGDEVLLAISNAINRCIRSTDDFCRYDSEEFTILISGIEEEEAIVFCNKILNAVRTDQQIQKYVHEYKKKISVSIGLAIFKATEIDEEFTNEEIFKISSFLSLKASLALSLAKKNGKDQFQLSPAFSRIENVVDINVVYGKILMISNNQRLKEIRFEAVDVDVIEELDVAIKICELYDIVIFDMQEENINIMNNIRNFRSKKNALNIGVLTEHVRYKAEIESLGARFLIAPLEAKMLEEWLKEIKKNKK